MAMHAYPLPSTLSLAIFAVTRTQQRAIQPMIAAAAAAASSSSSSLVRSRAYKLTHEPQPGPWVARYIPILANTRLPLRIRMMGEDSEAVALHAGGGEDGGATGGCWVSGSTGSSASSGIGTASSGSSSSSSLFSSTSLSVGDEEEDGDGATSSSRPADRRRHSLSLSSLSSLSSSTSAESEASQMNGAAGGPLYGMLTMQDHLPALRTGLSKYYQGRSESFTSLADVICVEDLAKKTTPYIRRPKASRRHAAALGVKNRLSKTVAKKEPRGRKLAASECQGKLYRC